MSAEIRFVLPANWSNLTGQDLSRVQCRATTIHDALRWLADQYPRLANRFLTPDGRIPRYATVAVDGECLDSSTRIDRLLPGPVHEICVLSAFMGG